MIVLPHLISAAVWRLALLSLMLYITHVSVHACMFGTLICCWLQSRLVFNWNCKSDMFSCFISFFSSIWLPIMFFQPFPSVPLLLRSVSFPPLVNLSFSLIYISSNRWFQGPTQQACLCKLQQVFGVLFLDKFLCYTRVEIWVMYNLNLHSQTISSFTFIFCLLHSIILLFNVVTMLHLWYILLIR